MKQMNRKTLTIAGGVLAAVIVGAVLMFLSLTVWAQPSKQDYEIAKKDAEKIVSDYPGSVKLKVYYKAVIDEGKAGKFGNDLVKAVADEKKLVLDTVASRRALADKIGESRVVKDEETKKSYDAYLEREISYDAYYTAYVDAFTHYYSSLNTCIKIFEIGKQTNDERQLASLHKTASKDCLVDLSNLSKTPITPYADYAKELTRIVNERQKALDAAAKDPATASAASAKIRELSADYSKNDPTDKVIQYAKDNTFSGQLDDLIAVLDKKVESLQ